MDTLLAEKPMAKREDTPVRIANDVLEDCRIAAAYLGKSLSQYISDSMRPIAKRDMDEGHARKSQPQAKPKAKR